MSLIEILYKDVREFLPRWLEKKETTKCIMDDIKLREQYIKRRERGEAPKLVFLKINRVKLPKNINNLPKLKYDIDGALDRAVDKFMNNNGLWVASNKTYTGLLNDGPMLIKIKKAAKVALYPRKDQSFQLFIDMEFHIPTSVWDGLCKRFLDNSLTDEDLYEKMSLIVLHNFLQRHHQKTIKLVLKKNGIGTDIELINVLSVKDTMKSFMKIVRMIVNLGAREVQSE